jgi:integrase
VRRELRPLSAVQVRAFLAATVDDRLGPLYTVAIGTGLRQGELLGLRWQDVANEYCALTVTHTLDATGSLAEPKTSQSRRTLRLGRATAAALREQRRRQLEDRLRAGTRWRDTGHVFASSIGTPLDGPNVTHEFQAALSRAGLPRQRFHDMRHAAATLLLESGEDVGVVSRILGHSTVSLTLDIYGHLTDRMTERAAARMDAILEGTATG